MKPTPEQAVFNAAVESLSDTAAYASLERDGELVLDGRFTIAELEAIVAAAKAARESSLTP
jgi:hypothetical protein